jgi:hypothetical protein
MCFVRARADESIWVTDCFIGAAETRYEQKQELQRNITTTRNNEGIKRKRSENNFYK